MPKLGDRRGATSAQRKGKKRWSIFTILAALFLVTSIACTGTTFYVLWENTTANADEIELTNRLAKEGQNPTLKDGEAVDELGVPAFVVSLIKCTNMGNTAGFIDSAAVLRHSVHKQSRHYPGSNGKYSYKMYAIIHANCAEYAPLIERVGYTTIIRDTPVKHSEMRNEWYRKNVESEMCCGSAEFIKLYSYTLMDHPVVVHFDLDKAVLKPFDGLFDAMLLPADSEGGRAARAGLVVEWPEDVLPEKIDAYFTRDYTSNWPWKIVSAVQGGLLVHSPSMEAFEEYMEIVREGNFTPGFNNEAGWGGLGFGGWVGGKAYQGIIPYFYDHFHPNTAVELDVCKWNQVAADVIWRGPRGQNHIGQCRKYPRGGDHEHNLPRAVGEISTTNNGCDDCRITPIDQVYTVHYTACKKPWGCPVARTNNNDRTQRHRIDNSLVDMPMCMKLHREWFQLRKEFEDLVHSVRKPEKEIPKRGTFNEEYYLGFCEDEGKYIPISFPEEKFDISELYPHTME